MRASRLISMHSWSCVFFCACSSSSGNSVENIDEENGTLSRTVSQETRTPYGGVLPQVSKRKGMLEIVDKLVPGLVLPWVDSMKQPSQLNLHPATLCFEDKELEEKYRKHEDEIPATFKEQKGWSPSRRAFRLMFTVTSLFNLA